MRAFWASALREWLVLRRYPSLFLAWLFWPIALPFLFFLQASGFGAGDPRALHAFAGRTGTTSVAGFLFVGFAVYIWLSQVLWGTGTNLRTQQVQGQLESVLLTPASRLAVLFGPVPTHLVFALYVFLVVGLSVRLGFGVVLGPAELLRALAVMLVSVPAMYGLGTLFAAAVLRFQEVNGLVQAVRGIFQIFCGMTFPIVVLPGWAREVALALPPTYIIGDFRGVLLAGTSLVQLLPDFAFLIGAGGLMSVLAVLVFNATERYARRGGQLVQY